MTGTVGVARPDLEEAERVGKVQSLAQGLLGYGTGDTNFFNIDRESFQEVGSMVSTSQSCRSGGKGELCFLCSRHWE